MEVRIREEPTQMFQEYAHHFREDRRVFPLIGTPYYYRTLRSLYAIEWRESTVGLLFQYPAGEDSSPRRIENALILLPLYRGCGFGARALIAGKNIPAIRGARFRVAKTNGAAYRLFSRLPCVEALKNTENYTLYRYV